MVGLYLNHVLRERRKFEYVGHVGLQPPENKLVWWVLVSMPTKEA